MQSQLSTETMRKQLELIFETSSDGIWVCDAKARIIALNSASERLNSVKAEEVIGQHVSIMEKENIVDRNLTPEVIAKKKKISIMQYNQRSGRYLFLTGKPAFDEEGNVALVVVNERDMTQLKQMQNDLEESQQYVRQVKAELASINLQALQGMKIVAENKKMRQVYQIALKLAQSDTSKIMILGDSGTGKSLMGKFIHKNSDRSHKPFIQINCAALPEGLLEAELFGYEKGAFTGAKEQGKAGLFELAHEGTLFLDEIGDMPFAIQSKLLTYFDDFVILRLGSTTAKKIDCRLIAATNQDFPKLISEKKFRQDLFHRLNTFTIEIPPLKERPEDILELTRAFLNKYNEKYKEAKVLGGKGIQALENHDFSGNVRELENLLKEAVVLCDIKEIDGFIMDKLRKSASVFESRSGNLINANTIHNPTIPFNLQTEMDRHERSLLLEAAKTCRNKSELARAVGLSQPTAFRKLRKYGINL